jgi:hypothetical protein
LNRQLQETAEREVVRAITADEQAGAHYHQILKRFIPLSSDKPQAPLDSSGLKEIDSAWRKFNDTSKNLRRAYMKLYGAYI